MTPNYWSADKTALLVEYLNQGLTRGAAAQLLGVTRNAAIGRAYRIGYRNEDAEAAANARRAHSKKLSHLYDEAIMCRMKNNGCRPARVLRQQNMATKCRTPSCSNTRLPGYLHGLCSKCNTERLALERKSA